jgi:hypothetical protein
MNQKVLAYEFPSQISVEDSFLSCVNVEDAEAHLKSTLSMLEARYREEIMPEKYLPRLFRLSLRFKGSNNRKSISTKISIGGSNIDSQEWFVKWGKPLLHKLLQGQTFSLTLYGMIDFYKHCDCIILGLTTFLTVLNWFAIW